MTTLQSAGTARATADTDAVGSATPQLRAARS